MLTTRHEVAPVRAIQKNGRGSRGFRFGSFSDLGRRQRHVRFAPKSGLYQLHLSLPEGAKIGPCLRRGPADIDEGILTTARRCRAVEAPVMFGIFKAAKQDESSIARDRFKKLRQPVRGEPPSGGAYW